MLTILYATPEEKNAGAFTAKRAGLHIVRQTKTKLTVEGTEEALQRWDVPESASQISYKNGLRPRLATHVSWHEHDTWAARATSISYTASQYASIYGFPTPPPSLSTVIAVVSFGGGLYGSVAPDGSIAASDCTTYWSNIGIPSSNHPKVMLKTLYGAVNKPTDNGTEENTLDVQMIGGCFPSANLTIVLYILPNSFSKFAPAIQYITDTPIVIAGVPRKPSVISISWGAPEKLVGSAMARQIDVAFARAVSLGVNVCTASGDWGASDGIRGSLNVDFPSSSPNVIACGGTSLLCPNKTSYGSDTSEIAWSSAGGGKSQIFGVPNYQTGPTFTSGRNTPDIALNADPFTGVQFFVAGKSVVYGGTSVVAPAFAALIAMSNAKKFVNKILYSQANWYRDIVVGNNGGFAAKSGYDNASGFGSIKGSVLMPLLQQLAVSAKVVKHVKVTNPQIVLRVFEVFAVGFHVFPPNAHDRKMTWSSSDSSVVEVSEFGVLTALHEGASSITMKYGTNQQHVFRVWVENDEEYETVPVECVKLSKHNVSLKLQQSELLTATVLPEHATDKRVFWTSNNSDVVSVTEDGVITAEALGSADITATTAEGDYSRVCHVIVKIPATKLSATHEYVKIKRLNSVMVGVVVEPHTCTDKRVVWEENSRLLSIVPENDNKTVVQIRGQRLGAATLRISHIDNPSIVAFIHVEIY